MSEDSLYGAKELNALIHEKNLFDGVFQCLGRIWRQEEALADRHLHESEYLTRLLEQQLARQVPTLYDHLQAEMGGHPLPRIENGCGVVMDGLSVREGFALAADLPTEMEWEVSLEWAAVERLPTETKFICREWFDAQGPSAVNRDNFQYIGDDNVPRLPGTTPEFVWTRYPDLKVEDAMRGNYTVEELEDIYEDTKQLLQEIVAESVHNQFLVSSDHGYVNYLGGNPYSLSDRLTDALKNQFKGRFVEVGNSYEFHELEEADVITRAGGHYVVKGHYSWTKRGPAKRTMHGGLSLPECITPVLRIDTQATATAGDPA